MRQSRLALILRAAWKTHRLDTIRVVVQQTITDLQSLDPCEVADVSTAGADDALNPVQAALEDCCDELRAEGGLRGSDNRERATRANGAADAGWADVYTRALVHYENAACISLETSLAGLTGSSPSPHP